MNTAQVYNRLAAHGYNLTSVEGAYTIEAGVDIVHANGAVTASVIIMPSASEYPGRIIIVVATDVTDGEGAVIGVTGNACPLVAAGDTYVLVSTATNWIVLAEYIR